MINNNINNFVTQSNTTNKLSVNKNPIIDKFSTVKTEASESKVVNTDTYFFDGKYGKWSATGNPIEDLLNFYGPSVPKSVNEAFHEAAEECGYDDVSGAGGVIGVIQSEQDFQSKMISLGIPIGTYLTQNETDKIDSMDPVVSDPYDILGNSVASTRQALEKIINRIDNPLAHPDEATKKANQEEKEFYQSVLNKLSELPGYDDKTFTNNTINRGITYANTSMASSNPQGQLDKVINTFQNTYAKNQSLATGILGDSSSQMSTLLDMI